jgi:hypothetical protein
MATHADSTTAPIAHPAVERMALRKQMVAAVTRMLEAVDLLIAELDGDAADPDLEPSLGAPEGGSGLNSWDRARSLDQRQWARGGDEELEEDPADLEPSLGSLGGTGPGCGMSQERWASGGSCDAELDKSDDEPSLGASEPTVDHVAIAWPGATDGGPGVAIIRFDPLDQTRWATTGGDRDLEESCEDEGAQCEDEGWDSDSEPDDHHCVPTYANDDNDQTRVVRPW